MNAEQRDCPHCGTPFTWTPAAPRQKYCSTRCKHRWHAANGKPRKRRRTRDDPRPPATPADAAAPERTTADAAAPEGTQNGLAALPACPHCRKPVALVAWLVPPAAASVKEPPRHAGAPSVTINNQP